MSLSHDLHKFFCLYGYSSLTTCHETKREEEGEERRMSFLHSSVKRLWWSLSLRRGKLLLFWLHFTNVKALVTFYKNYSPSPWPRRRGSVLILHCENLIRFLEVKNERLGSSRTVAFGTFLTHELVHTQPLASRQNYLKLHFAYQFMAPGVFVSDKHISAMILFLFLFLYLSLCLDLYLCVNILGNTQVFMGCGIYFLFSGSILYNSKSSADMFLIV